MQDMYAPRAYHMCSARGLSCGGGLQDVHAPARSGLPTGQKEGQVVFQHQMADLPPMALVRKRCNVMLCLQGVPATRCAANVAEGQSHLRVRAVREHNNCGVHCRSLAVWESGGASTTVIGGLPELVRNAIAGLF